MPNANSNEGLKLARLLMVLSSLSPLFLLWAIRGCKLVPDAYFLSFCLVMVALPNLFLWLRIRSAKKQEIKREINVGSAEDHRDHLLVYLFATLLPFYSIDTGSLRDFAAMILAVAFVVFLFWHLGLHYMNILYAIFGYRVFTIFGRADGNRFSGRAALVLISPRNSVLSGERIVAFRLSDTVYFEAKKCNPDSTLEL